jgi:FAD/FMN-containing dehydrogenase
MGTEMKKPEKIVADLKNLVGEEAVVIDPSVLARQSIDYVGYRNWERFNQQFLAPRPLCLVKAASTALIAEVLQYCNANQVVVIPKTGNSCATGGIEPAHSRTIVLDGSDMNQILKVDAENMLVTVQCGVPLEYLENALNQRGFTTGHFPQSLPMAQIGGLVATRSIGQFSTYYGGIEDLVVGLEAVLPNGETIRIKNVPRRSAGPDIRHLFIGTEGALAYITEITLKLFPHHPENRWQGGFSAPSMEKGLTALREVMVNGYHPAVARLHDPYQAEHDYGDFVLPGEALFICVVDGPLGVCRETGKAIDIIFRQHGATPLGEKVVVAWFEKRNKLCYELDDSPLLRSGVMSDTCEISAVWSDIGGLYNRITTRIAEEIDGLVYICGHSSHSYGQGTNIYFKFGLKGGQDFTASRQNYQRVLSIIMAETLKVGGSIAHHHGVGKYRVPWIRQEHGSAYWVLDTLKKAFDPNSIMNEGTLFPSETDGLA